MTIKIASDHAGFKLKEEIITYLGLCGYHVMDYGVNSEDSMDYPDIVHPLIKDINEGDFGVLICGTGNGVNITANKYSYIRSALAWNIEVAKLSRQHNDANVICLPARFIDSHLAIECVDEFINTQFEGGRHLKRIKKINL